MCSELMRPCHGYKPVLKSHWLTLTEVSILLTSHLVWAEWLSWVPLLQAMTGDTPAASILELCHLKQALRNAVDGEERAEGPHIFKYPP